MDRIIIFGGGQHADYCIDIIERENKYKIIGIVAPDYPVDTILYDYRVIGKQENIKQLVSEYNIRGGLVAIGDNWTRKIVAEYVLTQVPDFKFINAIHPSTEIGRKVKLGIGIVTMAGCIINPSCDIGNFCFFATGAQLDHDSIMEDYSSISAGSITGGNVKIGKYSAITLNVTILDRISIGENSVIGAGSLVLKDIPDNVLVYGNPAKVIRKREYGERYMKSGLRFASNGE